MPNNLRILTNFSADPTLYLGMLRHILCQYQREFVTWIFELLWMDKRTYKQTPHAHKNNAY
jgi:hypothetical protein